MKKAIILLFLSILSIEIFPQRCVRIDSLTIDQVNICLQKSLKMKRIGGGLMIGGGILAGAGAIISIAGIIYTVGQSDNAERVLDSGGRVFGIGAVVFVAGLPFRVIGKQKQRELELRIRQISTPGEKQAVLGVGVGLRF